MSVNGDFVALVPRMCASSLVVLLVSLVCGSSKPFSITTCVLCPYPVVCCFLLGARLFAFTRSKQNKLTKTVAPSLYLR